MAGLSNNIYVQIGLVLLIALSAKNAILIVEMAREGRAAGKSILDAPVAASKVRFRPIMMTSFTFILGVMPLVLASGAGASARRSLRHRSRKRNARLHLPGSAVCTRVLRRSPNLGGA